MPYVRKLVRLRIIIYVDLQRPDDRLRFLSNHLDGLASGFASCHVVLGIRLSTREMRIQIGLEAAPAYLGSPVDSELNEPFSTATALPRDPLELDGCR